jgi:hypothetical protein
MQFVQPFSKARKGKGLFLRLMFSVFFQIRSGLRYIMLRAKGPVIRVLELVVTEKCTLRCKDCANLLQYYQNPVHLPVKELLGDLSALLGQVSAVQTMNVLGGEPFCYPHLAEVVQAATQERKIKRILIESNATIMPSDAVWQAMKHPKVKLRLSIYDGISQKIDALKSRCDAEGIICYIDSVAWTDWGRLYRRGFSPKMLWQSFRQCKHLSRTLLGGYLYYCPRAAHMANLGLLAPGTNGIDVHGGASFKKKWRITWKTPLEACDYCNPAWLRTPIPAAKQTKEPLPLPR